MKKYPFLIAAHDTCLTMSKVAANLTSKSATLPESTPARFPTDDLMFVKLEKILIECIDKKNDDQYIPMAQQVKKGTFIYNCQFSIQKVYFHENQAQMMGWDKGAFNNYVEIILPFFEPPMCGQFLYPGRGQKQTFLTPPSTCPGSY